jgi:hypothetical protein
VIDFTVSLALTALRQCAHRSSGGRPGVQQREQFAQTNEEQLERVFHLKAILIFTGPRRKPT